MAQYMFLLYGDESGYADVSPEQWNAEIQAHSRFMEQVVEAGGKILSSEALEPTSSATTVRGDVVTDGPFLETKEAFGGYYLIELADLDQALALAKLCPGEAVEVRPTMDTSGG